MARADVESAVGPGVEVAGAAEALSGLCTRGAVLSSVMDDEDGDVVFPLKLAEKSEQGGDLRGAVLVDAMEADERVEDEQARAQRVKCAAEASAIPVEIEA